MATFQTEERAKMRKHWVDHAIQLAMQSKWAEAVAANRSILENFPNDVDAFNRLGRALREQGQYKEAREAYQRAVQLDPNNSIAQKNLASLSAINLENAVTTTQERVDPRIFIAETGKSGAAGIVRVDRSALAKMAVGDKVQLQVDGRALFVQNGLGETIGQVEPKLAQRLIDLMEGGNKYEAALMSLDESSPRVILHETFQHPAQAGKVSFPTRAEAGSGVRPYTKESLLKYTDYEEDDEDGDVDHEGMTTEAEPDAEEALEPGEYDDESQSE